MEYSSAIKKNETMPSATTWMGLEIIILSELSQTEKDEYHGISLICFRLLFKQELWLGPRAWLSWHSFPTKPCPFFSPHLNFSNRTSDRH